MSPLQISSPRELGEALRRARLEADVTLEQISERTKIGRRLLEALEAGEFARLPDRVFVRMFLSQYLETLGQAPQEWLPSFDAAWERHARGSQSFAVEAAPAVRPHRVGPWIVGFVVVAVAVAVLVWYQRRAPQGVATVPSPTEVAAALAPTAVVPSVPTAAPTPTPTADVVIATTSDSCWVEIRPDGGQPQQRLLPPGSRWEIDTGGRGAGLTLGNAGAVTVLFRGQPTGALGKLGEVVHTRVGPPSAPSNGAGG